ncbi:MAG: ABC transporter ATP-binding protein [Clostridia bacterium]|nr:ABC transporter ATP-binding protein [Clostridia bacterium]
MARLMGLVRPLTGYMILAIALGLGGHLCAALITVLGGYGLLSVLKLPALMGTGAAFVCMIAFAALRAGLRYGEQACNHFIAFKLLALIRDHVFGALRRLCPAKLEGKDRGNLISVITADIELLEVFYAHTLSPVAIAVLFSAIMVGFVGKIHPLLGVVAALANLGSTLQSTFAAGNRVLDILDESPVVEDVTGQKEIAFAGAKVENVSFAYEDEQILSDVSAQIPQGAIIGVNGRSGSGKSTLLRLMMRFWGVQRGAICISGRNVEAINTSDLRKMQSFVTQDTHLFHDSMAENLRIAKPGATQEELEAACRKASVHDFIVGLPKGYETPVAELGDSLSSGERQRIGLARAFLHEGDMMLLDEPTSNLDSLNEAVILQSLKEERAERTVVLVSHRKSTMGICDHTYCVEHGRVS